MNDNARAMMAGRGALEADPQDFHSLHSLEHLLETMEDWRGALELYESEVEMLGEREPERRGEIWLRVGAIAQDHTEETERALRAYVSAAALGPLPPTTVEIQRWFLESADRAAFLRRVPAAWRGRLHDLELVHYVEVSGGSSYVTTDHVNVRDRWSDETYLRHRAATGKILGR